MSAERFETELLVAGRDAAREFRGAGNIAAAIAVRDVPALRVRVEVAAEGLAKQGLRGALVAATADELTEELVDAATAN